MGKTYRKQATAKQKGGRRRKSARGSRRGRRKFWQTQIDEAQMLVDDDDGWGS